MAPSLVKTFTPTYLPTPPKSEPPSPTESLTSKDRTLHTHLFKPANAGAGTNTHDVAELWLYILSLYFSSEDAYYPKLAPDSSTGGIFVEVWRRGNYLTKEGKWTIPADFPVAILLCLPRAQWAGEFPGVRFAGREGKFDLVHDVVVATRAQVAVRDRFVHVLGENPALQTVSGGIACGCMVRLFRCTRGGTGELKGWYKGALDLVYGVPGGAMAMLGRVLARIRKAG